MGHKRVQRLPAGGYPSRLGVRWSGSGSHTRYRSVGAARSPKTSGLALQAREAIVPAQSAQVVAASLLGREPRFKFSLRLRLICPRDLFHDMLYLLASSTSRDWSDSSWAIAGVLHHCLWRRHINYPRCAGQDPDGPILRILRRRWDGPRRPRYRLDMHIR